MSESIDRTADTVIALVPAVARAICCTCGTRIIVIGPNPRLTASTAADLHDAECAALRAIAKLLTPPPDNDDDITAAKTAIQTGYQAGHDRLREIAA